MFCLLPSHGQKVQRKMQPHKEREKEQNNFIAQTNRTPPETAIFCHRLKVYGAHAFFIHLYDLLRVYFLIYASCKKKEENKHSPKPNIK